MDRDRYRSRTHWFRGRLQYFYHLGAVVKEQREIIAVKKLLLTSIAALFLVTPANAEPINSADVWVIDADTIQVHHHHPNVRLVGLNAPETRNAACPAEAELGARATQRLRELVRAGELDFAFVRC